MNDNSSSHSAPPMSAFQGLILTKNSRVKKRKPSHSKTPIDPTKSFHYNDDDFGIGVGGVDDGGDTDTDCNSELTDDIIDRDRFDHLNIHNMGTNDDSIALFDNLHRNWSHGEDGIWEQACFAALCSIFYDNKNDATAARPGHIQNHVHPLPPPHRCVVTGLWSHVVLPLFLKDKQAKIPELVAQEVWNVLTSRLQYVTEDDHNTVSLGHPVYNDYGLKLAQNADTEKWKLGFAEFLQKSLEGEQPHFVQLYASQVIVPYWLSLGHPDKAASLLHQPSFISKEWNFLSKQENPLQITIRHIKLIELYLSKIPSSPLKWQEALGLYQGWHTLLQQEMELLFDRKSSDSCSDTRSQGSNSSKRSSSSSKRAGRLNNYKGGFRSSKETDPVKLLILGRSLYVLSMSLDSVLTELPGKNVALSVLWKFQAEYLSEAMQVLSHLEYVNTNAVRFSDLRYLLSAATWIGMSSSCATIEECNMDGFVDLESLSYLCDAKSSFTGESDEIRCLNVAKALLEAVANSKKGKTLQLIYWSLRAELQDAFGRWLFFKQRYSSSRLPLEEAVKTRRQILSALKDTHSVTLFWWGSSTSQDGEDGTEQLCQQLCLNMGDIDNQTKQMEISLAQSLEYGALTLHACDMSMAAMSWLQEALILKTSSLGKMELEIARLNSSMAVVHEDMMQWEAALSRYRECLRIRMHAIGQSSPEDWFSVEHELFHATLGTLGSMGTAHRMLGDHDNAVGCFWKIATMSKVNWDNFRRSQKGNKSRFWGFHAHQQMATDLRPIPLPIFALDEERFSIFSSSEEKATTLYSMRKKDECQEENAILSQAAQSYQIIMSLFEDKMRDQMSVDSSENSGNKMPSINLANCIAAEDVPLLLAASYSLGLIHVHFGDFRSAFAALEHSLNALWVIDPSSSESGSSSDDSEGEDSRRPRRAQRRKRALNGVFGNEMDGVHDEGVYHVLGICRAACGEHDQAVRFHLTALRCARRMYGVNSLRAGQILCDAATSYWYLKDYDKANEFWSESLRIRSSSNCDDTEDSKDGKSEASNDGKTEESNEGKTEESNYGKFEDSYYGKDSESRHKKEMLTLEDATILYNQAACLCALAKYSDPRALSNLEEAKVIFTLNAKDPYNCLEIANCLFYMAIIKFRTSANQDNLLLAAASEDLNEASQIYQSLGYLGPGEGNQDQSDFSIPNNPLKAHVQFLQASISQNVGKFRAAMEMYSIALDSYRALDDTRWDSYIASVYNTIGKLNVKMFKDSEALTAFEDALSMRIDRLGDKHEAVGETLYHMAGIHGRMDNLDIAMKMYQDALQIQMTKDGGESAPVATTLLMIASIYMKQGDLPSALDKLKGALTIRQKRTQRIGTASASIKFWSEDIADDYLEIFNSGTEGEDDVLKQEESKKKKDGKLNGQTVKNKEDDLKQEELTKKKDGKQNGQIVKNDTLDKKSAKKDEDRKNGEVNKDSGSKEDEKMERDDGYTNDNLEKEEVGLAIVLHCMGNVSVKLREHDKARYYFENSLRARRKHATSEAFSQSGATEVNVSDTFHNLGCLYEIQKDYPAALKYYAIALKLKYNMLRTNGSVNTVNEPHNRQLIIYSGKEILDSRYLNCTGSLSYAATLHRIGTIQYRIGSATTALACLDSALRIQKDFVGIHHITIAKTLVDIGSVLRRMEGKTDAARRCYIDAYDIRKIRKHGDANVGHVLYHIGKLYDVDMKYSKATAYYYQAFRSFGHDYARSIVQSICYALYLKDSLPRGSAKKIENLFSTDTSLGVPSIEDSDDMLVSQFTTVAKAIRDISSIRQNTSGTIVMDLDVDTPDCFINLQLYILGLVEMINSFSQNVINNARLHTDYAIHKLEQAGKDGAKTTSDAITFKMLYLIQE